MEEENVADRLRPQSRASLFQDAPTDNARSEGALDAGLLKMKRASFESA